MPTAAALAVTKESHATLVRLALPGSQGPAVHCSPAASRDLSWRWASAVLGRWHPGSGPTLTPTPSPVGTPTPGSASRSAPVRQACTGAVVDFGQRKGLSLRMNLKLPTRSPVCSAAGSLVTLCVCPTSCLE